MVTRYKGIKWKHPKYYCVVKFYGNVRKSHPFRLTKNVNWIIIKAKGYNHATRLVEQKFPDIQILMLAHVDKDSPFWVEYMIPWRNRWERKFPLLTKWFS